LLPHPLVARIALDRLRSALAEAPRGATGGR
ncbi:sirohydrochlorin cobaltochelatase, partial [Micrococcus sp. HSID17227]